MARVAALRLRPLTLAERHLAADLLSAIRPDEPADPEALGHELSSDSFGWAHEWYLALAADEPVGLGSLAHAPWEHEPDRYCYLYAGAAGATPSMLSALYDLVEERALRHEPLHLATGCYADEELQLAEIERRGYRRERLQRVWELDLLARREQVLGDRERSRAAMRRQGVTMLTLAACGQPGRYEKLLALVNRTQQDIPHSTPIHDETMAQLRQWLRSPTVREDRYWTAWLGDRLVALSYLRYPPVRGNVWTAYTACDREHRGRGIARAVKLESLGQAIELEVPRVRTDNDAHNAPMLRINAALGYRELPGQVFFVKPLD